MTQMTQMTQMEQIEQALEQYVVAVIRSTMPSMGIDVNAEKAKFLALVSDKLDETWAKGQQSTLPF